MIRLKKAEGLIYEYACHEGNYAMEGILAGARAEEAKAKKKNRQLSALSSQLPPRLGTTSLQYRYLPTKTDFQTRPAFQTGDLGAEYCLLSYRHDDYPKITWSLVLTERS